MALPALTMRQRADAIVREQAQCDKADGEVERAIAARPFFHAVVYAEELCLESGPRRLDTGFHWTVLIHYQNGMAVQVTYRISPEESCVCDVGRRTVVNRHERAVLAMQARAFRAEGAAQR